MTARLRSAVLLVLLAVLAAGARADLYQYLARPEPAYKWEFRGEKQMDDVTVYDLHLVSQTWQGIDWEHKVQIFKPAKLDYPGFCGLYNTGGGGSSANEQMGALLARNSGCLYAIVYGIPKQPLYGGKTEDALVVYTWLKYLETKDESWPLHFPMAKAVLKAADAIQAFAKERSWPEVKGFMVHGASKRGWTAWLVGASKDPRVKAIAPMVIDTLNLKAQLPHQLKAFGGKPSEQIADYTNNNVLQMIESGQADRLIELEDPYAYREVLTLPKLIINGTNDRYWAQDALNLYWDGLKGPKWVLYVPNSGHGLEDRARVFATLSAFIRANAAGSAWPQMKWTYSEQGGKVRLTIESTPAPVSARLFSCTSETTDFRSSRWSSVEMTKANGGFSGEYEVPASGYAAIFGEATYTLNGKTYTLSTQIRILGGKK